MELDGALLQFHPRAQHSRFRSLCGLHRSEDRHSPPLRYCSRPRVHPAHCGGILDKHDVAAGRQTPPTHSSRISQPFLPSLVGQISLPHTHLPRIGLMAAHSAKFIESYSTDCRIIGSGRQGPPNFRSRREPVHANHADLLLLWRRAHCGPERHANHDGRENGCANLSEIHWFQFVRFEMLPIYR